MMIVSKSWNMNPNKSSNIMTGLQLLSMTVWRQTEMKARMKMNN